MSGLIKNKDPHQGSADSAYTCPYSVGGSQGQALCGFHQQKHTGH